ncbi:MAG: sterol desaturase family protein [Elusimicrobiota bacterium]
MDLTGWIVLNEGPLRLGCFLGIFLIVAALELLFPKRKPAFSRLKRWPSNLGVVALNGLFLRVLVPWLAVDAALWADWRDIGLLHAVEMPFWLEIVLAVVILDLLIYAQHVVFHLVGPFWRLHRMHHSDLDYDLTTGARFHPIEIVASMLIKIAAVILLGAPAAGVVIFEIVLNGTATFNHGNLGLPKALDRWLRLVVVTPDMHRVHHSKIRSETDSNYGFNLPWWDRLFGTYRDQPREGHRKMTIGLGIFRDSSELRLDRMLRQPFIEPR